MKPAAVPFIIFFLVISAGISVHGAAARERNGGTIREITWSGDVDLTENLTIEGDQRLVIEEGTNVTFGLDVYLTIEGEVECGDRGASVVSFSNAQDRLSGGLVLINCPGASFVNTDFTGLALAVESIYSTLAMDACELNNTGIGILCYESRLDLRDTDFADCDMAGRFIRSNVVAGDCRFSDNLQSLMIHDELEMIGAYYHYEIAGVGKTNDPMEGGLEPGYEIDESSFMRTGIGVSVISTDRIYMDRSSFSGCRKGIHGESSAGRITNCSFDGNKVDYDITGSGLEVSSSITPAVNFTLHRYCDITVTDDEGKAVSDTELRISHPDLANMTYRTDENGAVSNIPLLRKRSVEGTVTIYSGYNVTVRNGEFEGYYPIGDEEDILITPSDMITEEGDELIPVDREAGFVLAGIVVILVVVTIVRKSSKKGKRKG